MSIDSCPIRVLLSWSQAVEPSGPAVIPCFGRSPQYNNRRPFLPQGCSTERKGLRLLTGSRRMAVALSPGVQSAAGCSTTGAANQRIGFLAAVADGACFVRVDSALSFPMLKADER